MTSSVAVQDVCEHLSNNTACKLSQNFVHMHEYLLVLFSITKTVSTVMFIVYKFCRQAEV